jgi:hypothetical protein
MGNTNAPFGFKPFNDVKRAQFYAVQTAPTINVFVGDLVAAGNKGLVTAKLGLVNVIEDANIIPATPGDATPLLGSVLACFDEDMDPISYIAAARVGDSTVAGYILVADHPDQLFYAQVQAALSAADLDLNYEIYSPALSAGNTSTGLSKQEIIVAGANTTNTIPIRIYGQYGLEDDTTAAYSRVICGINSECHYYGAGSAI